MACSIKLENTIFSNFEGLWNCSIFRFSTKSIGPFWIWCCEVASYPFTSLTLQQSFPLMSVAEGRVFLNILRKDFVFHLKKKKKKKNHEIISNRGTTPALFNCFQNKIRFICVNLILQYILCQYKLVELEGKISWYIQCQSVLHLNLDNKISIERRIYHWNLTKLGNILLKNVCNLTSMLLNWMFFKIIIIQHLVCCLVS